MKSDNNEVQQTEHKKLYEAPQLTVHGTTQDLTKVLKAHDVKDVNGLMASYVAN